MKKQLKQAKKQRLIALKLALKTIDCFSIPSLPPDLYGKYEDVKESLIKNYSK